MPTTTTPRTDAEVSKWSKEAPFSVEAIDKALTTYNNLPPEVKGEQL